MKFSKVVIFTLILHLTTACGQLFDPQHDLGNSQKALGGPLQASEIDFQVIKTRVLEPHCINCHTNQHLGYKNYQLVKLALSSIVDRVKTQNSRLRMPKGRSPLNNDLIALLETWVNNGAPEFKQQNPENNKTEVNDIDFAQIKNEVLKPFCTTCHTQYNQYRSTKKNISAIISWVSNDKMPAHRLPNKKGTPLSDEHKALLIAWAEAGAPETKEVPPTEVIEQELQPTWVSLKENLFGPRCIQCHNSLQTRAPINLSSYKAMVSQSNKLFNFTDPDKSPMISAILARFEEGYFDNMPPPWSKIPLPKVNNKELEVLKKWIELQLPYDEDDLF